MKKLNKSNILMTLFLMLVSPAASSGQEQNVGGPVAMTNCIKPDGANNILQIYTRGGSINILSMDVFELKSIYSGGYDETYRPQYHFTATKNFLGDVNGLVYYDGEYHLFFQYNPTANRTAHTNTHWGHAVSTDLVHWQQIGNALNPADHANGSNCFSGSCVIDWNNTSGFQTGSEKVMVAIYTVYNDRKGTQAQYLSYSNNKGRTFTPYSDNPVISPTEDRRDPRVFWYEPDSKWIMILFHVDKMSFYSSPDLKNWTYMSSAVQRAHPLLEDCPDLFELPVDGNPQNAKWLLLDGGQAGYTIGEFDGVNFIPETEFYPLDFGNNYYATQTFNDILASDGRTIQMAWMPADGKKFYPGMPFNQQHTFPVELCLRSFPDGIRLCKVPIREIENIHSSTSYSWKNRVLKPGEKLLSGISHDLIEIRAQIDPMSATSFGFNLRGSDINYNTTTHQLAVNPIGGKTTSVSLQPENGKITMHILLDRSSLEVFGNVQF